MFSKVNDDSLDSAIDEVVAKIFFKLMSSDENLAPIINRIRDSVRRNFKDSTGGKNDTSVPEDMIAAYYPKPFVAHLKSCLLPHEDIVGWEDMSLREQVKLLHQKAGTESPVELIAIANTLKYGSTWNAVKNAAQHFLDGDLVIQSASENSVDSDYWSYYVSRVFLGKIRRDMVQEGFEMSTLFKDMEDRPSTTFIAIVYLLKFGPSKDKTDVIRRLHMDEKMMLHAEWTF